MKRMIYIISGIVAVAVATLMVVCFITGCKKCNPDYPDNIDGGVVKSYTDPDAPKVIESTEITKFDFTVSMISSTDKEFSGRVFDFKAYLSDKKVSGKYSYRQRDGESCDYEFEAEKSFMESLYGIVSKYDFASHNGYYHSVSGLPDMYGADLSVLFASGESITASNNQSNFIENEAVSALIELFEDASGVTDEREWSGIEIYRTHMNRNYCFNVSILPDTEGNTIIFGYCYDSDGTEYSAEEPFEISDNGLEKLRALDLDSLAKVKRRPNFGLHADDKTVQKLVLSYPDGSEEEKELSDDTLNAIFDIALSEFKRNAEDTEPETTK